MKSQSHSLRSVSKVRPVRHSLSQGTVSVSPANHGSTDLSRDYTERVCESTSLSSDILLLPPRIRSLVVIATSSQSVAKLLRFRLFWIPSLPISLWQPLSSELSTWTRFCLSSPSTGQFGNYSQDASTFPGTNKFFFGSLCLWHSRLTSLAPLVQLNNFHISS